VSATTARRVAFAPNWALRAALLVLLAYTIWASSRLGLSWDRVAHGMG